MADKSSVTASRSLGFWESNRHKLAAKLGVDLTHAQVRYARVLERYVTPGCRWLEVGCGRQILPDWALSLDAQKQLVERAGSLTGIDVDAAMAEHPLLKYKVKGLGNNMPFRPGSFDLVTANMVVEHVENPAAFLRETHTVLSPGGRFLFHTTNFSNYLIFAGYFVPEALKHRIVWLLEKRRSEDIFPTWYQINTVPRIRQLATATNFSIEQVQVNGSSGTLSVLGPAGWAELLVMKAAASFRGGIHNSNIICVLRRQ